MSRISRESPEEILGGCINAGLRFIGCLAALALLVAAAVLAWKAVLA